MARFKQEKYLHSTPNILSIHFKHISQAIKSAWIFYFVVQTFSHKLMDPRLCKTKEENIPQILSIKLLKHIPVNSKSCF